MNVIYFLIPLSVLLLILAIAFFFWAAKNEQFSDLERPALDIVLDDARERKLRERGHHELS